MIFLTSVILLFITTLLQLILSPYTKVEESFNLHALHDYLHQSTWKSFAVEGDHSTFTGPIPRTFLGSIVIGLISSPIIYITRITGLLKSKFGEQVIVRAILAVINISSLSYFGLCARHVFGLTVGSMTIILCAIQFHLPFYSSRTLPNMFAFPLVQVALGHFLVTLRRSNSSVPARRRLLRAGSLLTIAAIVFRLELLALLAPLTILALLSRSVSFWDVCTRGFLVIFAALEVTVPLDSYFWQKLTWPEGASVYFNVIEGHASDWGVMPWHFYLTHSLPRLLGLAYPLSILGLVLDRKTFLPGLCATIFICSLSILKHKEWRFIVYIIPLLNLSASVSINRLVGSRTARWTLFGLLASITCSQTILSTYVSMNNYPGGKALHDLHKLTKLQNLNGIKVYIDDLSAQTGASRFLQLNDKDGGGTWIYDKLSTSIKEEMDLIITEESINDDRFLLDSFTLAFKKIQINWRDWPWIRLIMDKERVKTYIRKSILQSS
ncbi:hypothetical protein CROQUDRAFT_662343 [Cronartium quercuum f. sp. fusiforme G11]|uniref:Mannosyltransferase n=1 Tax=Cronartium quercuum f. sp. fusiforme G11 TaxID=708437 RepID=A0A9P6T9K4_9BASI|nr:hypothetical protein CROQUDRAFT_662343 [Cronartium quercuum f. sp. fusiforme G11]